MSTNKIIAVVKFNKREAFVLENPIELKYTKYYNHTIVGTDGVFLNFYYYDSPSGSWEAFAGRKFDLKLTDGNIEHCYGQWWSGITKTARDVIKDNIVAVTACSVTELKECYVFCGYYGIETKIKELREEYTGLIYEYEEYRKLLKELR